MLDAQEYLHLAIKSSQTGAHNAALEQLHHCLALEPNNAAAIFLLAAEHAELGLHERAIEGMEKALLIDPDLELAYLQLAILHLQNGNNQKAQIQCDHLENATTDKNLCSFARGLSLLCKNETDQAVAILQGGITNNTTNPEINLFISNLIKNIHNTPNSQESESESESDNIYLGAYSASAIGGE